jgi:ubiquinone/menaquinone biosynthesis C-methylase UbiE
MKPSIEQDIIHHYQKYDEASRLEHDIGPFEFARSKELIARYLPEAPAVILDAGGGTGVYSFWLVEQGYSVHLIDIVPRHIELARQTAANPAEKPLASLSVGDARKLDFPDEFAGVVLMNGPLYHLAEREDRLRALREAARVLKPGGILLAFGITRYAGLIYGLTCGHVFDPAYHQMIRNEVLTGHRVNPPDWVFTLPNAYFHLPAELKSEIEAAGMCHETTLGVLGPAWQVPDLETSWKDPRQRETLLDLARLTENEPVLGPRLMAVAAKL